VKIGLPPSPSQDAMRKRAQAMVQALGEKAITVEPVVADSYGALGDAVLKGLVDVAWAPPIVCARVEVAGGKVALRAVRKGATSYRGAIVTRKGEHLDLNNAKKLVAAWVDEDSAAGYLLARAWLAGRNIDAIKGFSRSLFCGSYAAALQAVSEKKADLTSIFASIDSTSPHSTLDEVDERLRTKLHIVAYTAETQTDGIVLPPGAVRDTVRKLIEAMASLSASQTGRAALKTVLACDDLRAAPNLPTSTALNTLATPVRMR
jgi:phosphonate transport system substrate-binding protein